MVGYRWHNISQEDWAFDPPGWFTRALSRRPGSGENLVESSQRAGYA